MSNTMFGGAGGEAAAETGRGGIGVFIVYGEDCFANIPDSEDSPEM